MLDTFKVSSSGFRHRHLHVRTWDRSAPCCPSARNRPDHLVERHHKRSGGRCTQAEVELPANPRSSLFRHLWVQTGRHPCDLCRLCRGAPHADGSRLLSLRLSRPPPSPRLRQPGLALRRVGRRASRQCCCPCSTRAKVCRRPSMESVIASSLVTQSELTLWLLNVSITVSAALTSAKPISAMTVGLEAMSLQYRRSPPTLRITLSMSAAVVPGAKLLATTT